MELNSAIKKPKKRGEGNVIYVAREARRGSGVED
jgi:hypothetical protein